MNRITDHLLKFLMLLLFCGLFSQAFAQNEADSTQDSFDIFDYPEWYPDTLIRYLDRSNHSENWGEIVITDQLYPDYLGTITFCPKKRKVLIFDSDDKKIAKTSKKKINNYLNGLISQINLSDSLYVLGRNNRDPLTQFGLDSNWYKSKILDLWSEYRIINSIELDQNQLEKTNKALMDYSKLHRILKFPNNWKKDTQAMIDLKIDYGFDTLHIQATSYFPYMLQWYYFNNQSRLANHEISLFISELVAKPKNKSPNLDRIRGVNFETSLMDDIYKRYLLKEVL